MTKGEYVLFGAIDIGSNAVRLQFTNVYEEGNRTIFKKQSIVRVPIRLGEDSFLQGRISHEKEEALIKSMKAFRHLIEVHKPVDLIGCATSAIRSAENGIAIVDRIREETGIDITIIDGQREAEIIYSNHVAEELTDKFSYLYIEVGGGSTEVTLFSEHERKFSRSFPIGTVRILHNLVPKSEWSALKKYLKTETADYHPLIGIGTGGNINCMFKLLRLKENDAITRKKYRKLHEKIKSYSLDERIRILGLRPDRADVIVPANNIFLSIMKWTDIDEIFVPRIGVADGIIHLLYEKFRFRKVVEFFEQN